MARQSSQSQLSAKRQQLLDLQIAEAEKRAQNAPLHEELLQYDIEEKRERQANVEHVQQAQASIQQGQRWIRHGVVIGAALVTLVAVSMIACVGVSLVVVPLLMRR